ncbi:MAG: carboxypeptidase-like regulatory domain-containing protein, partial [Bacteroidota bacterium]
MMTHVRKLLILACILISGLLSLAQENVLSISHAESKIPAVLIDGYVSAEDSIPLIGALVRIPGTSLGTVADENGYFQLNVPERDISHDTLEVSYITMASQKIPLSKLRGQLHVYLKYPVLDELEIIGYGPKHGGDVINCRSLGRSCCGYQIIELKSPLPNKIVTQPEQYAYGKVTIRCGSSISGHGPLYIIDGVPFFEASGGPLNTLAPEDIKEIRILKGNVASALYGSRGGYGVILITTKRKRGYSNLKSFSYSGLMGLAQLNETSLETPQLTFSQFLKYTQKTSSYKLNVSGNVRKLPGFEEGQDRNHFGGNVSYSRLAFDRKLEFGGRLSYNHIRERSPVLADLLKKNAEKVQYAKRTFNNYFSQAFARYNFSDYLKGKIDLSSYQNENLLFDRLGGNFLKPQVNFARKFDYMHDVKAEAYLSSQNIASADQAHLQQLSAGIKASYAYNRIVAGEIILRKENNSLLNQSQNLPAQYLSARARVNYDNLDVNPGGICAVSRGYLQARANLNQTPFFNQNTFALESEIGIGNRFRLNAGYTYAS